MSCLLLLKLAGVHLARLELSLCRRHGLQHIGIVGDGLAHKRKEDTLNRAQSSSCSCVVQSTAECPAAATPCASAMKGSMRRGGRATSTRRGSEGQHAAEKSEGAARPNRRMDSTLTSGPNCRLTSGFPNCRLTSGFLNCRLTWGFPNWTCRGIPTCRGID